MTEAVVLDWMVPERSWETFTDQVESEFGVVEGYLAREALSAMNEFAESDGYEDVEDKIDRLVRAAGRTPHQRPKEKKLSAVPSSDLSDLPTTRVTIRVDYGVKETFKAAADASAFDSYGVAFARALELYCDGGRAARLEDKLDRIVDDAEALLAELDESDADESLSVVERRTVIICNRLVGDDHTDQFKDDALVEEISDVAGSSGPTIERYRDRVIDRLGYEPHPNNSDIWMPADQAKTYVSDGVPDVVRQPADHLSRQERIERIQMGLGRRAAKTNGQTKISASEVQEKIFDDKVTHSSVRDLLNGVAVNDGFRLEKTGSESMHVKVDVSNLDDTDLAEKMRAYVRADTDGLLGETTTTTVDDWTSEPSPNAVSDVGTGASGAATDGGGAGQTGGDRDD
jgi:hypothetical protein